MKIEQLLVQHFYNAKEVTLQGIGTFTLSPDFVMPKDSEKDFEIPSNVISFQYNSRSIADEALIAYIVEQTRKMKSLAAADLDTYLVLMKQFLNIGKPYLIEGMGSVAKNQQGEYFFTQGHSFHSKLETVPAALKEKHTTEDISFASESKPKSNSKKILVAVFSVVVLGLLATSIWYFFIRKPNNNTSQVVTTVAKTDTPKIITAIADTSSQAKNVAIKPADGYTFKVVFMVTSDSAAAVARMNTLTTRGHKVIMYKADSVTYKLAEPFTLPLADTTHVKDSLNSFYFLGKGFIELK